jgi:hypothetical protein
MEKIIYKLEDQSIVPKILDVISRTETWMGESSTFDKSYWKEKFEYNCSWGEKFKIATAYSGNDIVAFSTALYSSSAPIWYYLQHVSVIPVDGLSKIYLEHGIHLTDTLVRHGESLGYYSYIGAWSVKHDSILDKIYNSPKRNKDYFRYMKLFERAYKKGEIPIFNTHSIFVAPFNGGFINDVVISNFVLRPEFRLKNL